MRQKIAYYLNKAGRRIGFELHPYRKPAETQSYSNFDEQQVIGKYLEHLGVSEPGVCVDIAAANGVHMSNTLALFQSGWQGLAVEYDPHDFAHLAKHYSDFPQASLARCKVTPETVCALLKTNEIPADFTFLSLDIDSYDYFVLEQLLTRYRPRLICAEINEKIPPPLCFTVKWDPDFVPPGNNFYGQSLSQLCRLADAHDYCLLELHYNNAFLMPKELSPPCTMSSKDAYAQGYKDRPDRKEKFPWNSGVEEALHLPPKEAMAFLKDYYRDYEGQFELTL